MATHLGTHKFYLNNLQLSFENCLSQLLLPRSHGLDTDFAVILCFRCRIAGVARLWPALFMFCCQMEVIILPY